MSKVKKKHGRAESTDSDKTPAPLPANPPRPHRLLLLTSVVLLLVWFVFLLSVARFG